MNSKLEIGQSSTEYLVMLIVLFLVFMLGVGIDNNGSIVQLFLNGVRDGFERFSSFMSLP